MKRVPIIVASLLIAAILCSCGVIDGIRDKKDDHDITYTASTRFLYSTDDGASWSETIRTVYTGDPYYLAVEMAVTQSQESREQKTVEAWIEVPKTDGLEFSLNSYPGGELLEENESDDLTSYKFRIVAGTSPSKFRVMFECLPTKPGKTSVNVIYDDRLNDAWDSTGTIKYVERSSGEMADSSPDAKDKETSDENGNPIKGLLNL